jgi:hypothetical protein
MSIPTQDGTAAGVLDIFANFYEFIPAEQLSSFGARDEPATLPEGLTVLRAHELEKGQQYFILPTNHAGLYRYHLGDLIVVTDYVGPTPVIEFLSRGAYTSSMTGEKLTEHQVVAAVSAVMQKNSVDTTTFTVTPVWADPPYYLLRLNGTQTLAAEKPAQLAREIDESLQRFNSEYRSKRRSHRLGSFRLSETARRAPADHDSALSPVGRCYHEQYKHRFLLNEPIHPGKHSDESRLTAFQTGQAPSSAQEPDV